MNILKTTIASVAVLAVATAAMAGDVSEEMRDVDAFTKVSLQGSMDVEIKVGSKQSVKVIADSRIIEHIRTRVHNGELEIDLREKKHSFFRNIKRMQIIITVPSLDGAELHGSGDMIIEGAEADKFELELRGSGDAIMEDAKIGAMAVELQGSGDIEIDGTCDDIRIELRGSGDIKARKMKCKTAEADLRGSGDISVHASEEADVTIRGSGDISVTGRPDKMSQKVRGSGDIRVS